VVTKEFTVRFTVNLPYVCPLCHEPCGHLYEESGLCLGCELDKDEAAIQRYEEQEAAYRLADAEGVCVCGID
jgi:hypothetical protein